MWTRLAHIVLKYRLFLIIFLALVTGFMAYHARKAEYTYTLSTVVPDNDPEMQFFQQFRQMFGEDGNIVAIGFRDSSIYQVERFRQFKYMCEELASVKGVNQVLALPVLQKLQKDARNKEFTLAPIFPEVPDDQAALDSMLRVAGNQLLYSNQIINRQNGAGFVLISISGEVLNTRERDGVIGDIKLISEAFSRHTGITLHYVGLPYLRTEVNGKIKTELQIFLVVSLLITALILFYLFRSWDAVLFPIIIIAVIVIWSLGTLGLTGYEITMLTGLLPPIIVIIGIPNSIYLLNKYHQEIDKHGNKIRALSVVIRKIGIVTLITNATTAVGFIVLVLIDIPVLREFGIVAGINIMATFLVSIILIPAVFSYLPVPKGKQLKHLKFRLLDMVLTSFDLLVHRHRYRIVFAASVLTAVAVVGLLRLKSMSFMVDDVPADSPVKKDLVFFEQNFSGIMPLEIFIDTKKRNGILRQDFLEKVDALESHLDANPHLSTPVSVVSLLKAVRQTFYNDNPAYYALPNRQDRNFILRYFTNNENQKSLLESFVDSSRQKMRISLKMADIGSTRMDSLIQHVVKAKIAELFDGSEIEAHATGTTLLFVKGNRYLLENLFQTMLLAFLLIAIIMGALFRNPKMIAISVVPNLIPLLFTAGAMGFAGVPLKPSSVVIFSVVFGISVDSAIHFLAKYRQELFANNFFVPVAISRSLREIGPSMIFTSVVLFAGFIIFSASDFVGTRMLGTLTSSTLLVAMFTNLIVLPALLMIFDDGKRKRDVHPLIEHYDEFYQEGDDEEIDLDLLSRDTDDNSKLIAYTEEKNQD
jgi:uncharacterized protein